MAMKRLQRLQRDESGMSYVFIGMGFMAFLSASMLAIDVGMLMTARSQAQNSADAGALAGATALAFDNYDDRSAGGPAVHQCASAAGAQPGHGRHVSVLAGGRAVPERSVRQTNRVRVDRLSHGARGNPVSNADRAATSASRRPTSPPPPPPRPRRPTR